MWVTITGSKIQILGDCGWDISACGGSSFKEDSGSGMRRAVNESNATLEGYSSQALTAGNMADNASEVVSVMDGPIFDGQRHPYCGGIRLDLCNFGAYTADDVGDGSCQQQLNTEECYYDGGAISGDLSRMVIPSLCSQLRSC